MRLPFNIYISACFFLTTLLACQSSTDQVSAHPRFHQPPIAPSASNTLIYADTNSFELRNTIHRLDSFYAVQVRAGFNGSVLIGEKGKIIYERYFGIANRTTGVHLTANSSSQLASTTKTFTGAAILYLYQHNYLNIDDPVKNYIPSFPYEEITIRMCLNHRSGLPDYLKWVSNYRKSNEPIYNDELIDLFAKYKPRLDFKSNTHFKYSNSNFAVLATVIEQVTEMRYSVFMHKYIFEPLGMKNTFVYDPANTLPANAAISYKYNWVREPDMFADGVYGDKGIYSTVRDMYRWDQSFYHNRLLNNETMELAYGPCSFEKGGIKNYGLGWRMLCYPSGNKIIYHNGWWHGNNTVFYRFIKENMTIIILGNKHNMGIYRQTKPVYSILKNTAVADGFDEGE